MESSGETPRYAESSLLTWRLAAREAELTGATQIEPEHVLLGLMKLCDVDLDRVAPPGADGEVRGVLEDDVDMLRSAAEGLAVEPSPFRRLLRERVRQPGARPERDGEDLQGSSASRKLFTRAEELARESLDGALRPVHLLTALLERPDPAWAELVSEAEPAGLDPLVSPGRPATPLLDRVGRDLTRLARDGALAPLIGRREELRALAQALMRERKPGVILVGEPGVGKTGIVEGLATRLAGDDVPPALRGMRIVELQIAALTAGTKFRGEFEKRMQQVLDEAGADDAVVLFIDEIHTLLGAGGEGASDAANIVKPALARGDLRVIGATTTAEYRRYVERDAALERRFAAIFVEEPTRDEAVQILTGLRSRLEAHHGIAISDEAIAAAVELSARHIRDRCLPDKAIDLIDQALAAARLGTLSADRRALAPEAIGREEVAAVVARRTRIPVERLGQDEAQRLLELEATLGERVVGQPHAVSAVSDAIRTARAGLGDPRRPLAVLLFAGPTGSGKTELAKALAELLFDDEDRLVRLDMSEYKEPHSVSRLLGAPPGYVGHDEREGELTGPIRTHPYSVILLDEIEKAHPDVLDLCLQIFDEGRLTDARGRQASFRDAVIVLTSNLGAARPSAPLGFAGAEPDRGEPRRLIEQAIARSLRPELLNRIQRVVVFDPLDEAALREIVDKLIAEVRERLRRQRGIELELSDAAYALLVREGFDERYGARELERAVTRLLVEPLARSLLEAQAPPGGRVRVDASGSELVLS